MKKLVSIALAIFMVSALFISCGSDDGKNADGSTTVTFWTFNELHPEFYEAMAEKWNAEFPDRKIKLESTVLPFEEMHNKLGISLTSGSGAPDLVDIEIKRYANFLRGVPGLVELNDLVEPELGNVVKSRFDIYSKDGKYYGMPFHVGATVMYYNKTITDEAGIDLDSIITWDDFAEAGKVVLEKTGKPFFAVETVDIFTLEPMLVQEGTDMVDPNTGEINVDSPEMLQAITFMQGMLKDGTAVATPGGNAHKEDFYGFMNNSGAAALMMPLWYMGRFTDYMPDTKGEIIIKPIPVWDSNSARSAGLGGTGTSVTKYATDVELTKDFLAYAKLSEEGNNEIWRIMGFDPVRASVWESDIVHEKNKFTDYFINNPFSDVLADIGTDFPSGYSLEKFPDVVIKIQNETLFQLLVEMKDPKPVLEETQRQLEAELN